MSCETMAELPMTLQHYPAASDLRVHVTGYFSIDGPADSAELRRAWPEANADGEALQGRAMLVFDLGARWWAVASSTGLVPGHMFVGPVFGALLKAGAGERLLNAQPDDAFATERLARQLRAAPSTAFRIVAMDRYLATRLMGAGKRE